MKYLSPIILTIVLVLTGCGNTTPPPTFTPEPTRHPLLEWINDFSMHAVGYQRLVDLADEVGKLTLQAIQDPTISDSEEWKSEMLSKSTTMVEIILDLRSNEDQYSGIDGVNEFAFSERNNDCLHSIRFTALQVSLFATETDHEIGHAILMTRLPEVMDCLEGIATELNAIIATLEAEEKASSENTDFAKQYPPIRTKITVPERTPVPVQTLESTAKEEPTPSGTAWIEGEFLNGDVTLSYPEPWQIDLDESNYVLLALNEPGLLLMLGLIRSEYLRMATDLVSEDIQVQERAVEQYKLNIYEILEKPENQNANVRFIGTRRIEDFTVASFDITYDRTLENGQVIALHRLQYSFVCSEIHSCEVHYDKISDQLQGITDQDQQVLDYFVSHITNN